jgi:hypothetical protein
MKLILLCLFLIGGCAASTPGVSINAEEAKACEAAGCSVWTEAELHQLIAKVASEARAMAPGDLDTHGCLRGRT